MNLDKKKEANIFWFKKDLRLYDNEALENAVNSDNPLILIYSFEPSLWLQGDSSYRQFKFAYESVQDLKTTCNKNNLVLNILREEILDILIYLNDRFKIENLYSHQETGNMWSFKRDLQVKSWCDYNNVGWSEVSQFGVIRVLKDRDGWASKWYHKMSLPETNNKLNFKTLRIREDAKITATNLNLKQDGIKESQIGGREHGLSFLYSFFKERGENYSKEMSSPVTAFDSCSRISPYLTYGCISVRETYQYAEKIKRSLGPKNSLWKRSINSFTGRLRWHCHFIQKLEDEPELEFKAMHPMYDELDRTNNEKFFKAWSTGNTGFTMVDSSMRALILHGWINFRMRAMLVSFATNHLWLDWRIVAEYLAKLFIDYEPGIHYSQIQMQSAVTGINAIRIYNPIKQTVDQDKEGTFIRKYIPELKDVSTSNLSCPSNEPLLIGDYPLPIVDEAVSRRQAAKKLYDLRKKDNFNDIAKIIIKKHASRKTRKKKV